MIKINFFHVFYLILWNDVEMMLRWCWDDVEMFQDYFIHEIFQHAKKQLEIILYVTCLKCRDIPDVSKKHVSSNQTENISN
jgi:hypothetical protein